MLLEIDKAILSYTDTIYDSYWDENRLEEIEEMFQETDSIHLSRVLTDIGFPNSHILVSMFYEKINLTSEMLNNSVFVGKSASEASVLFTDAYEYYLDENIDLVSNNSCAASKIGSYEKIPLSNLFIGILIIE